MALPFVISGQFCSVAGACIAGSLGAPVWAGVVLVGGAIAGATFVASKAVDKRK